MGKQQNIEKLISELAIAEKVLRDSAERCSNARRLLEGFHSPAPTRGLTKAEVINITTKRRKTIARKMNKKAPAVNRS